MAGGSGQEVMLRLLPAHGHPALARGGEGGAGAAGAGKGLVAD